MTSTPNNACLVAVFSGVHISSHVSHPTVMPSALLTARNPNGTVIGLSLASNPKASKNTLGSSKLVVPPGHLVNHLPSL